MTERTMSDRLVRPEGRSKREGREVAGVRRPGVFHCHSMITETVLGLAGVIREKLSWKSSLTLQEQPWWYRVLVQTNYNVSQLYQHPVLIMLVLYIGICTNSEMYNLLIQISVKK